MDYNIQILNSITKIYSNNVNEVDKYKIFFQLTKEFMKLSKSRYGYFGDIFYDGQETKMFCKILIDNIDKSYNDICNQFPNGLVFDIKSKVYGIPYYTQKYYIDNKIKTPSCKMNIKTYFTCPLIIDNEVIGLIALGDREGGYDEIFYNKFHKYIDCCANILSSKTDYNEKKLLQLITTAQRSYIEKITPPDIFSSLLNGILELTNSEYGFIGEVLYDDDDLPYLKTMAITNIAWNDELKDKFKYDKTGGIIFKNLNTLFGLVMTDKRLVISNHPDKDIRRGGISKVPHGHPPLKRFCGIPFFLDGKFIGMVGIANSPQDYHSDIVKRYEPFLNTCSLLINTFRREKLNKEINENNMKFISQISHELKTPLNSILGFSQLLKEESDSEYVDYIIKGGELLMNLINNSLNLNRLDTYSINNTYILLSKTIDDYINESITSINKLGLKVINYIPANFFVYCDKFLFDRIMKNIISNAIKYNMPSGIIEFNHKIVNTKIYVTCKNSGELKIDKNLLFKPFETSNKYGSGTGLGLSLIKKICLLLNEDIECDLDEQPEFIKFTFSMNYKENITKKIVYLEDNKMNQMLMTKILKDYDITMKDDAHGLLDYIRKYDLLLLDMYLNTINGFDVIKILKNNNIIIPIIVITADTNTETLEKLHKLGIKYFNKPIMIPKFKEYIKQHFLDTE